MCVRVPRARHRGRAGRRRGYQRALAGRGGVGRSAVAVSAARRRVSTETRGNHEWALFGLGLWGWTEYVRVYKGRSGLKNKIQMMIIFATNLNFI